MAKKSINITKYSLDSLQAKVSWHMTPDVVVSEQPLQIILHWYSEQQWHQRELSMTMRTPGDDKILVVGFLLSQQIITAISDIQSIKLDEENVAEVKLSPLVQVDWQQLSRTFVSHSGCGICGQSQLKSLALNYSAFSSSSNSSSQGVWLSAQQIISLPALLAKQQTIFAKTGGCHGAGIWCNEQFLVCEDVGRHNAVDKVIGRLLQLRQQVRSSPQMEEQRILVLSGRVSFELVQKAIAGKIAIIVAVGAPSDLAVATAKQFNMTLIGFVKPMSFNVYCGQDRIIHNDGSEIETNLG